MTDKQKKEELKQVVTNLGNIEFTVEDELKFCKEVLKRKEQECEKLNNTITNLENTKEELLTKIDQLKVENKEYKDIINKLAGKTIAITSGDKPFEFCDHKDLTIKQLKLDKETYKYQWEKQYELCEYWQGQAEKYKQVLQEIKEIANKNEVCPYVISHHCDKYDCKRKEHCEIAQILQKISEVEDDR